VTSHPNEDPAVQNRLGLWDATSIVVGIIIGVGIFASPSEIFANVSGPWQALAVWVFGGILSLVGALCFAELASTYPRSGGEYVYFTRAFGSWAGFLFAWAQLAIMRTGGSIAAPAYVFADHACIVWDFGPRSRLIYAVGIIVILTLINTWGINPGRWTQNSLAVAKVAGLGVIVVAGFLLTGSPARDGEPIRRSGGSIGEAMIMVLYAYLGWNEAAYVTSEVRNRRTNLPAALIIGTLTTVVIYLLVNGAYLAGLGFADASRTGPDAPPIAARVLNQSVGIWGSRAIGILAAISALGTINGVIFAGSRIYRELGADYRSLGPLGHWSPRLGTPVWSLALQASISIGMVLAVATWSEGQRGFALLVKGTAPAFWFFFLLTGIALIVLRFRDPEMERPFRVPLFPVVPIIYCASCAYMLYASVRETRWATLAGIGILIAGVPLYLLCNRGSIAKD
jgi:amino acid transporter